MLFDGMSYLNTKKTPSSRPEIGCRTGCKFRNCLIFKRYCGERGIRTPGGVTLNGFQDRRNRPLCHLSIVVLFPLSISLDCECKVRWYFLYVQIFWRFFSKKVISEATLIIDTGLQYNLIRNTIGA